MLVTLRIDSKISFEYADLMRTDKKCYRTIKRFFTRKNPTYEANEKYGYSNHDTDEYLKGYEIKNGRIYIWRGCLRILKKILVKYKHQIKVIDRRLLMPEVVYPNDMKCLPRAEQKLFIKIAAHYEEGLIQAYTSFGKSLTALMLARFLKQPILILVDKESLQKQWINEATDPNTFNMDRKLIGGVGGVFSGKKRRLGLVNICLYQSLSKPEHLEFFANKVGVFVFDETQKAPIEACQKIVQHIPAKYRFGMSANIHRKDKKEFLTKFAIGQILKTFEEKASDSKVLANIVMKRTAYSDDQYEWDKQAVDLETRASFDKKRNSMILNEAVLNIELGKIVLIVVSRKYQACRLAWKLESLGYRSELIIGNINKNKDIPPTAHTRVAEIMENHNPKNDYEKCKELAEKKELDAIVVTHHKAGVGMSITTLDHLICSSMVTGNEELLNQILGRIERQYKAKQIEDFGHSKPTPSATFLWDYLISTKQKDAGKLKKKYGERLKVTKIKRRT